MRIVLASTSPRRKKLCEMMGLQSEIVPTAYEEDMTLDLSPQELALTLALGKGEEVASREDGIIISADTFVAFDGEVIGKSKDREEAFRRIKSFSGNVLDVITGVALIHGEKKIIFYDISKVYFNEISDEEIHAYLDTDDWVGKGGAMGIEGIASVFIKKIDGCPWNVSGLPVPKVYEKLKELDIRVYEEWKKQN
jgi:septum formation protein